MNPAERQYEQQATHRINSQRFGSGTLDNSHFNMLTTTTTTTTPTSDSATATATAKRPRLESDYQRPPFSLPARLQRVRTSPPQALSRKDKLIWCIVYIGCIPRSAHHVHCTPTSFTLRSKHGTIAVGDPVFNV